MVISLKFTDGCAKHNRLFLPESAAIFEFIAQENARNGIGLYLMLVLLCPFSIWHREEIHSATERVQDLLVNVLSKLFVVDAVAFDEFGSPGETEVSACICPPLVFEACLQEAALDAAEDSFNSIFCQTVCLLNAC